MSKYIDQTTGHSTTDRRTAMRWNDLGHHIEVWHKRESDTVFRLIVILNPVF